MKNQLKQNSLKKLIKIDFFLIIKLKTILFDSYAKIIYFQNYTFHFMRRGLE